MHCIENIDIPLEILIILHNYSENINKTLEINNILKMLEIKILKILLKP